MKWSYVWKNRTRKKYEEAHSGYIINFLPAKTTHSFIQLSLQVAVCSTKRVLIVIRMTLCSGTPITYKPFVKA